jgi:hypothetical protein
MCELKVGRMSNSSQDVVWVPVPTNCRMVGEFEVGHRVPHITIMDGDRDVHLLLERDMLDRVMRLCQQMLAVPENNDPTVPPIILESTHRDGIQEIPRLTLAHEAG